MGGGLVADHPLKPSRKVSWQRGPLTEDRTGKNIILELSRVLEGSVEIAVEVTTPYVHDGTEFLLSRAA
jgi:hypothetical protein